MKKRTEEDPLDEKIRDSALTDAERSFHAFFDDDQHDPQHEHELLEGVMALAQAADCVLRLRPMFQGPHRYGGAADILHILAGLLEDD